MTVDDIKEAFKKRKHVIYKGTEYKLSALTVWLDESKNALRTSIVLKDLKANSAVQVEPEKIERIKE
jgi:hypothetical protein